MSYLFDLAGLIGVALLAEGARQIYPPLVFVVPGVLLVAWSIHAHRRHPRATP
jgi:hypothetical protein